MAISLHEALAALRGATFNGERGLTLRLADGEPEASAPDLGPLPEDPTALARAYRAVVAAAGRHPGVVRLGGTTVLLGVDADHLGEPVQLDAWEIKPADDAVVAVATARDRVVKRAVAVVTGAAQGFGAEIARGLAAAGAQVVLADLNVDGARARAAELNEMFGGSRTSAADVDVAREESVAALASTVVERYGGVDLVVSNAGVLRAGSVKTLSAADFRLVTEVNYVAFFLVTRAFAPCLAAQNAAAVAAHGTPYPTDIVEINSKSGLSGSNRNGAYAGSKFGGIGLVQSFALELVEDAVKVNAICPGNFFDGPLWSDPDQGLFVQYLRAGKVPGAETIADVRRAYERRVPMGRGCTGADVVRAILSVVEQKYETGQAVPVTGGQEMLR